MFKPAVSVRSCCVLARTMLIVAVSAVLLGACGESEPEPKSTEGGQTIARINGQEITIHELEAELRARAPIKPENRPAAYREALRHLVQRTLLAQKAVEFKLDRTPEVMLELRRKRNEVLAEAFLSNALASQLPISASDVEGFIETHPHYFSERNYYVFDQLLIKKDLVTDDVMNAIKDLVTLKQVEDVLAKMDIPYSRRLNSNVGNQFSREMAATLDGLKPNEIFFIRTRDFAVISRIVEMQPRPVGGKSAREVAKRLLAAQRDADRSRKIIDDLLVAARIDFLGEFSDMSIVGEGSSRDDALSGAAPSQAEGNAESDREESVDSSKEGAR